MALIDFELLRAPLSEDAPCGPDLDQEGDTDYLNLMAEIEGVLPASYYSFNRGVAELDTAVGDLSRLLERSRDLRVMTVLAKLLLFQKNLAGFSSCLAAMAGLLENFWDAVNPGGDDIGLRSAALQTLDDIPHVIFPLQYLPLVESRRPGGISFRSYLIAIGEVKPRVPPDNEKPRAEETSWDLSTLDQAISDCNLTVLIATRDELARLKTSIATICSVWIANAGFDDVPTVDKLSTLVDRMLLFVDGNVGKRDPAAALNAPTDTASAETDAAPAGASAILGTRVNSKRDVAVSLTEVIGYFNRREPSNPALLLIRQARDLVGKNFIDVLRVLIPDSFEESRITVGSEQRVFFPMGRLSELMSRADDEGTSDATDTSETEPTAPIGPFQSRPEAIAALEQVSAFYRTTEPSSPIPLLIDRARGLVSLDFMTLLKEITPKKDS